MEVYYSSIRILAAHVYTPAELAAWAPEQADAARWQTRLSGLMTLVAEKAGKIAGFASITQGGHLEFLFTHPDFARQGIATALCREMEVILAAEGICEITTHASLAAQEFFEHQGYSAIAEERVECRGEQLRRFAMRKPIRA